MPDDREENDKSITNALSALGWVEEKKDEKEIKNTDKPIQEQINLFIEQNRKLSDQINTLLKENKSLKGEKEALTREIDKVKSIKTQANIQILKEKDEVLAEKNKKIQQLESKIQKFSTDKSIENVQYDVSLQKLKEDNDYKKSEINNLQTLVNEQSKNINDLNSIIQEKQNYLQETYSSLKSKEKIIEDQTQKIKEITYNLENLTKTEINNKDLKEELGIKDKKIQAMENHINQLENLNLALNEQNEKINELTSQIDFYKQYQNENKDLIKQLEEKAKNVKALEEQIKILKEDTVQKSKLEKTEILLEEKDEIINEKEKIIFEVQNNLNMANQKIGDLEQQLGNFKLIKKDLEEKEEYIKSLGTQIEEKTQKAISNEDLIKLLEEKLDKAQKSNAKCEVEINKQNDLLNGKDSEIKSLKEKFTEISNKLYESDRIEEKILNDLQQVKDEKLKLETTIDEKKKEIVELKKKIKLMRRELSKS
jgi:exonuclease SbcC